MKFGVKTYRHKEFLDYFVGKSYFFEVQAIQTVNYNFLQKYVKLKIPIVIHAEHFKWGFNPTDKTKKEFNLKSLNFARKLADKTKAKKIIIHPGRIINKSCSKEQAIKFFREINDKRILIENLTPNAHGFFTPKEIKEFITKSNKGFIYDLSHSIATANQLKKNKLKFIKDFLKLKPKHFHINGQNYNSPRDQHRSFKTAQHQMPNFKKILKLYPKDAEITLEVTPNIKNTAYDLNFIRDFVKNL